MKKNLLLSFGLFIFLGGSALTSISVATNPICNGDNTLLYIHIESAVNGSTAYAVGTTSSTATNTISSRTIYTSIGGLFDTTISVSPSSDKTYYLSINVIASVSVLLVVVSGTATATAGSNTTICSGVPYILTGSSIGGSATNGTWSIVSSTGSMTTATSQLSNIAATTTPAAVTFTPIAGNYGAITLKLTPSGPCAGVTTDNVTLTVDQAPTTNAGRDTTICTGTTYALFGSSIGGSATSGTWSILSATLSMTTAATQLSNTSSTGAPAAVTFTPIAGNYGTVTLKLTSNNPGGAPCTSSKDTVILTINPLPTANAGSATTICSAYTLSTATIGGSANNGTWSITAFTGSMTNTATQLSNTSATTTPNTVIFTPIAGNSGTVTLTLTTDDPAGPCGAVSSTVVLTVNPTATIFAGSAATICSGEAYTLSGASLGLGASTGTWSITAVTGTMVSTATQLSNTSATASPASVTFTPISTNSGTVTLTLTSAGACATATSSVVLTVNLAPVVYAGSAAAICSGIPYALVGSSIGGGATDGTWSITSFTGGMSGATSQLSSLAATGTPSSVTFTPIASSGTVTLTLTSNDPSGPCVSATSTVVLTVSNAPVVNAGPAASICSGAQYALAGATIGGGASTGTWSITSATGTMTTAPSQLSSIIATGTPALVSFTPISTNSGTVTLTLTTDDPTGPCNAVSSTRVLTISLAPTVNAGSANTICSGSPYTLVGATIGGGASNGTWSITSVTGTMTTASSQLSTTSPTLNPASVTFTPLAANGGTVTLTLTTDDPAGACIAVLSTVVLTVNKVPTVSAGTNATICAGTAYPLAGSNIGGGATTGTWSITSVTGTMTNAASQLSNTLPTLTPASVTFTPLASSIGTVTLTLTTDDPSGPCLFTTSSVVLTVNEPALVNAGNSATICKGTPYALTGSSIGGSATTGTWSITASTGTMTTSSSQLSSTSPTANPSSIVFSPNGNNTGTVTLTLTTNKPAGPCNAVSSSIIITISNAPTSNAGSNTTICSGSGYALAGSNIGGAATTGTWSISAVTGTMTNASSQLSNLAPTNTPSSVIFTPISTNSGTVTLTLTTDDPAGPCPAATNTVVLTVDLAPTVNAGSPNTLCSGNPYSLSGSNIGGGASTGVWSITSVTGTMTNASSQLSNITPTATPSSVIFTPIASNSGTVTLTLSTNDPFGPCGIVTNAVTFIVNPAATVNAGIPATVCAGIAYPLTGSGIGGGATTGTWSITAVTGTMTTAASQLSNTAATAAPSLVTFTAALLNSGTVTLTLTTDDPAGPCNSVSTTLSLTINPAPPKPVFNASNPVSVCYNQQGVNYAITALPNTNYLWSSTDPSVRFYGKRTPNCLIDFPSSGSPFKIYVTAINPTTGCRDSSFVNLSTTGITPTFAKVIATNNNKTLVCLDNSQSTFQWGFDNTTFIGTDVTGATLQDFTPLGGIDPTKNYYVKLNSGGCNYKVYYNAPLAISTSSQTTKISLQPNPNAGSFKLMLEGHSTSENGIITDILGNQVALLKLQTGMNEVHIENLPGGIYFLQIINSFGNRQSLKFIINK